MSQYKTYPIILKILKSSWPYFLYVILSITLYPFYKYVIAQDEISYITIALKYFNGSFYDAINGIWSPLITWLLLPFILVGIFPPFAFKILQIIIGFFILLIMSKLIDKLKVERSINLLFRIVLIPIILFFIFFTGTPDLLLACLIIFYIYLLINYSFNFNFKRSTVIGFIGSLIYLSKAYGFPFFIVHFTLLSLIGFFFYKSKKKEITKYYFTSIIVFSLLSVIWIFLLSFKYDQINYTLAGDYNYNFAGPRYNSIQTLRIEKLYQPVNETAVSYWEDPSFLKTERWSPFESLFNFKHQLKIIFTNLKITIYHFSIYLFLLFILLVFHPSKKLILKNSIVLFLIYSLLIYLSGLLLIMIEERFLIFPVLVLLLLSTIIFSEVVKKYHNRRLILYTIYFVTLIVLVIKPTYSIIKHFNYGKVLHFTALNIKEDFGLKGNIVSRSESPLAEDWANSTYIAYLNNGKYFGEIDRKKNQNRIVEELIKYNINYLLIWDKQINLSAPEFKQEGTYDLDFLPIIKSSSTNKLINSIKAFFGLSNETYTGNKRLWIYSFHNQN